ncbi:hypothetical protein CEJ65_01090, partial [Acinetobacter baumannii]
GNVDVADADVTLTLNTISHGRRTAKRGPAGLKDHGILNAMMRRPPRSTLARSAGASDVR